MANTGPGDGWNLCAAERIMQPFLARHAFIAGRVVVVLVALLAPASGLAQTAADTWTGLDTFRLQTLYVRVRSGQEVSGKLLVLDPDRLLLLTSGGEQSLPRAEVSRIQTRDSLKNGALVGAVAGVAMGLVTGGIADCPGRHPGGACAGIRVSLTAVSVGVHAAIGTGIDALIRGRSTIYRAPDGPADNAAPRVR
jgi:hypothetical protein